MACGCCPRPVSRKVSSASAMAPGGAALPLDYAPPLSILSVVVALQNDSSWLAPPTGTQPGHGHSPPLAARPPAGICRAGGTCDGQAAATCCGFPDDVHGHHMHRGT